MASYEQSVSLLRQNKRAQVEAVRELGFADVNVETRASLFPTFVKWAAGLLDITVAVRCKGQGANTGANMYFTLDEWSSMSSTDRAQYVLRGLRLRVEALTLIIALSQQTLKWGVLTPVAGAANATPPAVYHINDSRYQTECIVSSNAGQSNDNCTGSPAAEYALGYRAFTAAYAGFEDQTQWSIPSMKHMMLLYKYRNQINAALQIVGSDTLSSTIYWTCCQRSASEAYRISMVNGQINYANKSTGSHVVRPVAVE